MEDYKSLSEEELKKIYDELINQYSYYQSLNLSLNMARGKPHFNQVSESLALLDVLNSKNDYTQYEDYFNYGLLDGTDEAKQLFADILSVSKEHIIVYGNSSLTIMFDQVARGYTHGYLGHTPWCQLDKVKFLCPVPGYDRHFAITERFGIEMINIPYNDEGPDMDLVEQYVSNDESVKGMWCVPQYSNPNGITYSDNTIKRLAALKPAAKDFRLFYDNAYIVHHIYDEQDHVYNIFDACKETGNEDMIFEFTSTSKITIPGSGVAAMAMSLNNKKDILEHMTVQSISHDKLNQLRHALYFKDIDAVYKHMEKQAEILRPKFELTDQCLEKELGGLGICSWSRPLGGYFVSFESLEGCAKDIVRKCKEAGVMLTDAGATYPYKKDPKDTNIRIAPSYPSLDELKLALDIFTLCVKIVSIEKILN